MDSPIFVAQLELTERISEIVLPERFDDLKYTGVYLLVRLQHVPVGYVFLHPDALDSVSIARQVWEQLGVAINVHCERTGLPTLDEVPVAGLANAAVFSTDTANCPLISVVVCTRDRPEGALATLRSLTMMHYQPFEVVLVDNAPTSEATKEAVLAEYEDDPRVRYVQEPRPGLSCARNRGLTEAAGDIIAFTDDDVTVDQWWLHGILRGFRETRDVACVTGLAATAQLENAVQLYFHLTGGWGDLCERRVFDLVENRDDSPLYPYSAGIFGVGANFAVTRVVMKEIGVFDEALGAGTVTGGGEDLEIFMRIILGGNRIVYEPAAVVWHYHRADLDELASQMLRYGSGCTAALTAIMLRVPRARYELPLRTLPGILRMLRPNDRVQENRILPTRHKRKEIWALLFGPILYLNSRRKLRRFAIY